jgi:hypothetical protein
MIYIGNIICSFAVFEQPEVVNGKFNYPVLVYYIRYKAKALPLHATKALGWRGSIAPTHSRPRHSMGGEWSASRPGRTLPPGKDPRVPTVQEAGGLQTQRLQEKSFRLCRGSNLDRPVVQPVVIHYID